MGPNDAYRIVWALGEFFFLIFVVFAILNSKFNRFSNDGTQTTVTPSFGPRYFISAHILLTRPRQHGHDITPHQHQYRYQLPLPRHTPDTTPHHTPPPRRVPPPTTQTSTDCRVTHTTPITMWHHLRRLQRRYRAQTTRYASFGPLVSFF